MQLFVILQGNCWDNTSMCVTTNSFYTFQNNYLQMTLPFDSRECYGDSLSMSENGRLLHTERRDKMGKR